MSNATTTEAATINLPSAEDLDTGAYSQTSGYRCALYLVPAAETEDGVPRVAIHRGVGNIGWPAMAHNNRWLALGDYGPQVVGESILEQLVEATDRLIEMSEAYQGAEWDGNNRRGSWDLGYDWREEDGILDSESTRSYWDAADWFGPANIGWVDLCGEASVDPERALGDDWETVADEVAAIVEPLQEEPVSGTADYARDAAERYRDEQAEGEDD